MSLKAASLAQQTLDHQGYLIIQTNYRHSAGEMVLVHHDYNHIGECVVIEEVTSSDFLAQYNPCPDRPVQIVRHYFYKVIAE